MRITNYFKLFLLTSLCLLFHGWALAQDTIPPPVNENDIEQKIENIAENANNDNLDYSTLLDKLEYYHHHPLNLNDATRDQLEGLMLLNDVQINNLLDHIQKYGKLINIYELQTIDGFTPDVIQQILPYVMVSNEFPKTNFNLHDIIQDGKFTWIDRYQQTLEQAKGFQPVDSTTLANNPNARYLGSPGKIYSRLRFIYSNKIDAGITAEKDPGEQFFKGTEKNGFDFYSAHLLLKNIGPVKAFAVGDYQVSFGQGLTAWTGLAFGKTSDVINIKKYGRGISQFTSTDENHFLRGVGATVSVLKHIELTAFYSRKKIDAHVLTTADTLTNQELVISSLQQSGYHRTPAELSGKDAITEENYGGHLTYEHKRLNVGFTVMQTNLSANIQQSLSTYNQFQAIQPQELNTGVNYSWGWHNYNFFGETSSDQDGNLATLNGVLMSLAPNVSFSILQRSFSRNYRNLMNNAFAENSSSNNENGVYMGVMLNLTRQLTLSAYYDQFSFPWLKYQVDAPSHGSDYLAQLDYLPSKHIDMYFRIRQQNKFKNTDQPINAITYIVPTKQVNYRYNISYAISPSVTLRNRVEWITYNRGTDKPENGYMVYQDIIYRSLASPLTFSFRYALFQTDSYDTRLYAYESNVAGAYAIPAYYYNGMRTYLTVRYNLARHIALWLRCARTVYTNKNVISSGLNEIDANHKTDVTAQFRYEF